MDALGFALVLAHILALSLMLLTLYAVSTHFSGGCCSWETFGLHPILMATAFGFFGQLAAIAYKTYEKLLGWNHDTVKALHAILNLSALLIAILGVRDMWIVHSGKGNTDEFKHFQSLHSWIGIFTLFLFALQTVLGMIYFFGNLSAESKRAYMPLHKYVGVSLAFLTLFSLASGCLSLVHKYTNEADGWEKWRDVNIIGVLSVALAMVTGYIFTESGRREVADLKKKCEDDSDRASLMGSSNRERA